MLVGNFKKYLKEQTDPESVDLSSFEIHEELDQDFWNQKDDKLDPVIREKLLVIANDFGVPLRLVMLNIKISLLQAPSRHITILVFRM